MRPAPGRSVACALTDRLALAAAVLVVLAHAADVHGSDAGAGGRGATSDGADRAFVRTRGNQLVVDGVPFRFAGANLAIMHGPESRAGAGGVLAEAARDGIRVGRIWALGEGAVGATAWQRDNYYFRVGPSRWIDAAYQHLDRVLVAAARSGVRLIVTLSNSWSDYGGVPQYLRWAGRWHPKADAYGVTDRFYADPRARAAFRAHVERLLQRTNSVSGVPYRDDPTILAWELMNESRVDTTGGVRARRAWIVEMARLAHRLDPHHLVTSGVTGYRLERERAEWLALCQLPEIDYCDGHFYPEEMLGDRPLELLDAFVDDFAQLAEHVAKKPFVLGEFGVHGDAQGLWRGQTRAAWTARIFERLRYDGAAGGLVWIYQSTPSVPQGHGISVGEPGAAALRAVLRAAADAIAVGPFGAPAPPRGESWGTASTDVTNPLLGPERGTTPILPLRAEIAGSDPVVPIAFVGSGPDASVHEVTWDPTELARASWEASGTYAGGVLVHVWGSETGFFEFDYEVAARPAPAAAPSPSRGPESATRAPPLRLTLRARLSSEFPGASSPPDGASVVEVSIDGFPIGRAVAPRDDGRGRPVSLTSSRPDLLAAATSRGRHHLRFAVTAGPQAHGLCLYGAPGAKPEPGIAGARVELEWAPLPAR